MGSFATTVGRDGFAAHLETGDLLDLGRDAGGLDEL